MGDESGREAREPKQYSTKEKRKIYRMHLMLIRKIFFFVFFLIAFIGLLLPLRPTESALENRTLTEFPQFTVESFLNGDYFSDISTWYADTFPLREKLISAYASFENHFGLEGEQIVQNTTATADEIPEDGVMVSADAEEEEEVYADGVIDEAPEQAGNVYVSGDTAFEIYYFSLEGANLYIEMMEKAVDCLDGVATIYDILVPTSMGINLTDEAQEEIGASDQAEAIDYIFSNLNSQVKTVEIFQTLRQHDEEYLYFRTDHHWTALAAYYAYTEFCEVKGITATELTEYETMEFDGFVGSLYSASNQVQALKDNPDTVTAYIPLSTNDMFYIESDGDRIEWDVVHDVTNYDAGEKYATFAAGDQVYAQIDNPQLDDGSSCVVIKESYGNAFIPFLVDHYQTVYIVDYRYFGDYDEYGGSLYRLVTENDVSDVIFINNAMAMTSKNRIPQMSALFDVTAEDLETSGSDAESSDAQGNE